MFDFDVLFKKFGNRIESGTKLKLSMICPPLLPSYTLEKKNLHVLIGFDPN